MKGFFFKKISLYFPHLFLLVADYYLLSTDRLINYSKFNIVYRIKKTNTATHHDLYGDLCHLLSHRLGISVQQTIGEEWAGFRLSLIHAPLVSVWNPQHLAIIGDLLVVQGEGTSGLLTQPIPSSLLPSLCVLHMELLFFTFLIWKENCTLGLVGGQHS